MKIRDAVGDVIAEVATTPDEDTFLITSTMLIGMTMGSDAAVITWMRIVRKIYEAGLAKGRAYDPRAGPPSDPMGLVGPSDAETIGYPWCPWCPWCRERAHFGACPDVSNDALARRIRRAKPEDS
jgi:hypothetical protein